jgi:diamine N-acetyltransferase
VNEGLKYQRNAIHATPRDKNDIFATMLKSDTHALRALEPTDSEFLYELENASEEWWLGATISPLGLETLKQFAGGQHDLYRDLQLRLMITTADGTTVGTVDLYQYEPRNRRAGVGIAILNRHRKQGHARAGLALMYDYAFQHLGLHQLWAEIPASNAETVQLFQAVGFEQSGHLKDWIWRAPHWEDAVLVQALMN